MMGGNFRTVNPPQNPATVATTITPTASTPTARSRPRLNISSASAPAAAFISLDPLQSPSGPRSSSGENYTWIRVSNASISRLSVLAKNRGQCINLIFFHIRRELGSNRALSHYRALRESPAHQQCQPIHSIMLVLHKGAGIH